MTKTIDLSQPLLQKKPAVPPVVRPRTITGIKGVRGAMPLRPTEGVLTPEEEAKLTAMGWKPGDPLPGDLPERIKALKEKIKTDILTGRPVQMSSKPAPLDVEEDREVIEEYLRTCKEAAPQIEAAMASAGNAATMQPEVRKALADAGIGIEVYDSRKAMDDPSAIARTMDDMQTKVDEVEGKKSKTRDEEPKADPLAGFDYKDVLSYVSTVLAYKPFRKSYTLLGGRLVIAYQQLSTAHAELVLKQVASHIKKDGMSQSEAIRLGHLYRMILGLESITIDGDTTDVLDAVAMAVASDTHAHVTPLPEVLQNFKYMEVVSNESIWRMCRDYFTKFTELIDALEAKAEDPDFWNRIEE